MKSKKSTIIRIVIFTVIANLLFVPSYIRFKSHGEADALYGVFTLIATFSPAIANVLTRLITKEGFRNNFLRSNFKGNARYYVYAVLYGLADAILGAAALILIFCPDYKVSDKLFSVDTVSTILLMIPIAVLSFWVNFGEEFGWRAYLTPKLKEVLPAPAAHIISGTTWGLWHTLIIINGHNYGVDYAGYPYAGLLSMCISCIFIDWFLSYITEKTQSVYPASIAHSCINNMGNVFMALMIPDYAEIQGSNGFVSGVIVMSVPIILSSIVFIAARKKGIIMRNS